MARFLFKLEAVLKQRRAVERARQVVVAGLEGQRLALEDQIRAAQARITAERQEMRACLAPGASVQVRAVRMQAGASLHAMGEAQRAVLKLAGLHRQLDTRRRELLDATTKRKAVQTLRERRLTAWRLDQKRLDDAAADELTVMRTGRADDLFSGAAA